MRDNLFQIILLFLLFWGANIAHGYDVAVLYDVSGSVQWSQEWRSAIRQANEDIIALIGDGRIANEDDWMLRRSPLFDSKIQGCLLNSGNHLLYIEFAEIEAPTPPFFTHYQIEHLSSSDFDYFPKPFSSWLFDGSQPPKGKLTFLDLAKWQALSFLDEARATDERILIVFSDFDRDVGGRYAEEEMVLEKVIEYHTEYKETTLLKAFWKARQGKAQLLGFQVFLIEPIISAPTPTPRGEISYLTLSPSTATVRVGDSYRFRVSAFDKQGNAATITPSDVTWTVLGNIGNIDEEGWFQATTVGTGQIQATLKKSPTIRATTSVIEVLKSGGGNKNGSALTGILLTAAILIGVSAGGIYLYNYLKRRAATS